LLDVPTLYRKVWKDMKVVVVVVSGGVVIVGN